MKDDKLKQFLLWWGITFVALAIVSAIFYFTTDEQQQKILHPLWIFELLFVAVVTLGIYYYTWRQRDNEARKFISKYQIAKTIKLFLYFILLVGYVFVAKREAFQFLIDFMVYYIGMSIVETVFINKLLKHNKNQ